MASARGDRGLGGARHGTSRHIQGALGQPRERGVVLVAGGERQESFGVGSPQPGERFVEAPGVGPVVQPRGADQRWDLRGGANDPEHLDRAEHHPLIGVPKHLGHEGGRVHVSLRFDPVEGDQRDLGIRIPQERGGGSGIARELNLRIEQVCRAFGRQGQVLPERLVAMGPEHLDRGFELVEHPGQVGRHLHLESQADDDAVGLPMLGDLGLDRDCVARGHDVEHLGAFEGVLQGLPLPGPVTAASRCPRAQLGERDRVRGRRSLGAVPAGRGEPGNDDREGEGARRCRAPHCNPRSSEHRDRV